MGEVLFLAHRIPFPPDRGDKIRSHHVLKAIAALAPVHVGCLADDPADMAEEAELAALAASHCLVRRSKPLPLAGLEALVSGKPVSLTAFHHPALAGWVRKLLATRPISAICVFSGQMAQYVPDDFRGRVVMDFVDVDSAKFEAYADAARWPACWLHAREERLLRAEEARASARADVSLLISEAERALFGLRLPPEVRATARLEVLPNGIDAAFFDPAEVSPEPRMAAFDSPRLIFTGQMDYAPNVAAALRAIDRIMPLVREVLPTATFHVVGRNPAGELLAREGLNGARIWGRVDDIRTWLAAADLALVPLDIARGVQNKVLEAMAMGLPVVLTSGAATGIPASNGTHFCVRDEDTAIAAGVTDLLRDTPRARAKGEAARRFVLDKASWPAALVNLPRLLGLERGSVSHVA